MQTERLLRDTGKGHVWLRLLFSAFGLLGLYGSVVAARGSLIAAAFGGALGLLMVSIWFWRAKLFYDSSRRELVERHTLFGTRRITLSSAEAVYVRDVRTFSSARVDIGLRYHGSRDVLVTFAPLGDPEHVAATISDAIGLPLIRK